MNRDTNRQRKLEEQEDFAINGCRRESSGHNVLKVLGVAAAVVTAIGVVSQWQDIRRYVRMIRM
jgi:hypothetical protein